MSDSLRRRAAIQAVLVDSYDAWEAGDADGMVANCARTRRRHDRLAPRQPGRGPEHGPGLRGAAPGQLDLQQAAEPPLRRQGRRDRRQRIRHPVAARPRFRTGKVNATWASRSGTASGCRR